MNGLTNHDLTYFQLLRMVRAEGNERGDRTGTGTVSLFGAQARFDLRARFPLLTTKKIHWPSVVHELLWFLKGDTNIGYLNEHGVKIWDAWATEDGDLGPVYGAQWRSWECPGAGQVVDQIAELVRNLKSNPFSRRHIVSAWNPAVLPDESLSPVENARSGLQALPPCHTLFQFYVQELSLNQRMKLLNIKHPGLIMSAAYRDEAGWEDVFKAQGIPKQGLSCQLYQRSADMFLGVPFNIASYSLLTHMIAHVCGMQPMEFIWTGGDCHIYSNHLAQVEEQLNRTPLPSPTVRIEGDFDRLEDIRFEDIILDDYNPLPAIKAPIAV